MIRGAGECSRSRSPWQGGRTIALTAARAPSRRMHGLSSEGVGRRRSSHAEVQGGTTTDDYPEPARPMFPDDVPSVSQVAGQARPPSSRGRANGWLSSATGYLQQVAQHVAGGGTSLRGPWALHARSRRRLLPALPAARRTRMMMMADEW